MDHPSSDPSDLRLGATHMVVPVALFNRMASVYYAGREDPSPGPAGIREPQRERASLGEDEDGGEGDLQSGPGFGTMMWPEGDPAWERVQDAQ